MKHFLSYQVNQANYIFSLLSQICLTGSVVLHASVSKVIFFCELVAVHCVLAETQMKPNSCTLHANLRATLTRQIRGTELH